MSPGLACAPAHEGADVAQDSGVMRFGAVRTQVQEIARGTPRGLMRCMRTIRWPSLLLLLSLTLGAAPLVLTGCDDPVEHGDLGTDAGVPDLLKPDLSQIVDPDMGGHD